MSSSHLLHFDLSQGCTVRALISSLQGLGAVANNKTKPDPISVSLIQKSQQELEQVGYTPTRQDIDDLTQLALLLTNLDPSAVSCTRIPLSFSPDHPHRTELLKLSEFLPVYDKEWPAPSCDLVALAWIKTCAARFGARGESRLIKMGVGMNPEVRALWCKLAPIVTRTTLDSSALPRVSNLLQASCLIADSNLIPELVYRLEQIGCKKTWTTQVLEQGNQPKTLFSAIANEASQNQIIEIFLILGQASEIQLQVIEQHSLQKRTIGVAFGTVQKQQVCRVVESLWGDRILRADPLQEDLMALTKSSGQAQEIIRADILSAWKKRVF